MRIKNFVMVVSHLLLSSTCVVAETEDYYKDDSHFTQDNATFLDNAGAQGRFAYQEDTNKNYKASAYPYFEHRKELSKYFKKKNQDGEAASLWNIIEGVEGYSPRERKVQNWDTFYTKAISNKITGVGSKKKEIPGSVHGLNIDGQLSKEGREAFIIAAIHAGFNSGAEGYRPIDLEAGNFKEDLVNQKLSDLSVEDQPKVMRHRLAFQAFKNLMVGIENMLSQANKGQILSNSLAQNQWPQIFKKEEVTDSIYKGAVETVIMGLKGHKEINDHDYRLEDLSQKGTLRDCLMSYKETFIKFFIGVTSINNDRMWGIVRDQYIDEEEQEKIDELAKASVAGGAPKPEDLGVVVDEPEKLDLKVNAGAGQQVIFDIPGGAYVYKKQIKNNDKKESIVVPFWMVKDMNKKDQGDLTTVMKQRRPYLLVRGENLTEEQAKIRQELFDSGRLTVFSTPTPEIDGVFAYFEGVGVQMIARPFGDLVNSIFSKKKADVEAYGEALHKLRAGHKDDHKDVKSPSKKLTIEVKIAPENFAGELKNEDEKDVLAANLGAPGKKFSGRQDMFAQDKDGKHYLWVYTSKTPNEDKILVLDAVPQIEGKGLSDLYKEGLFWWYDNALFYVKVGKTDKDTKIVAINTTSKELVNKHQDALSGLIEGRLRPILRVRKPKG